MEEELVTSVLEFNGYEVTKMYIENVPIDSDEKEFTFCPELSKNVEVCDENNYKVYLSFQVEPTEEKKFPFKMGVTLCGKFTLVHSGDELLDHDLIHKNTVAILFPFMRTIVSTITLMANKAPLMLPIINLADMFNK